MNKELMYKRFSKNLDNYDKHAKIQKKMADRLLSFADSKYYEKIFEFGCGTGILTKFAAEKLKYKNYTANDIVENCKNYIVNISSDINFISADMEEYLKNSSNTYDLIISNASLQWAENTEYFIKLLYEKLNPNGTLLVSTFGTENFREIKYAAGKSLHYYSKNELEKMLKIYSHKIEEEIHIMAFKTPKEVLKHISLTGVNGIEECFWTKKDLEKFEDNYNNICSNSPTLTYNPIYIKIKK